ncbi:MarR family transcriptional regulator [uncultured Anaerotruncus sp.]|uniref:MarR family winged helix-turn-helix transcriptional regulator n=1 Tax=uncultured Anaerotruncus sp. TaxID=905011 RepID=UPI00280AD9AC|nr:MarR family transcriptional regulator [uncultured Anaerotruncus sp.]
MEPAEFKNQIWVLMRDITDRMNGVFHPIIDRYGLTIMQMRVLFEIRQANGCTVSGLSRRVCAAGANVSALCKRLERAGLLERSRDPRDERVVRITLTEAGRRTVTRAFPPLDEAAAEAILDGMQRLSLLLQRRGSNQENP